MYEIFQVKQYDLDPGDTHIDTALSQVVLDYRPTGFIANDICPVVNVAKQSDRFFKIDQGDRFRDEPDYRAPGQLPNYISFDVSSDGYFCKNYALGSYLTREEIANADAALANKNTRAELIMDILMINQELRVANLVNSTSNVQSSTTTASAWGDTSGNADPYLDMQGDIATFEDTCGYSPNIMVMGKTAWRKLRDSEKIQTLIFPHGGGIPTVEHIKNLIEVPKVLIGGAYRNSAAEGASMTLSKIWDDNVFYGYVPERPAKDKPSFMYSFRWTVAGVPAMQVRTFPFDDKTGRQDMHIGYYQDEKITDKTFSFLRTGVGSSQ